MLIICITEALAGEMAEADREADLWFEKDYLVIGKGPALLIYPKTCWKQFIELTVPTQ